jgi:hypothetical protein
MRLFWPSGETLAALPGAFNLKDRHMTKVHYVPTKTEPESPTLPRLLETLDLIDKQLIDMPESELDIVREQVPKKVDSIYLYLESLDVRIDQLRQKARSIAESARALENKREAIETYIASKMVEHGFEKLPGEEYVVAVRPTEAVEVDSVEFTDEFLKRYKDYIKTTHELSKSKLKADLREGLYDLPFARMKKNHHLRFAIKRKE